MIARLTLAAALAAAATLPAAAQHALGDVASAYGCAKLGFDAPVAVIEGQDGVFFRRDIDMRTHHTMTPQAAALVGRLSRALARRGTTLVYVPLPSKSLAMPDAVPPLAADYGFDETLAILSYEDVVARLRAEGVATVDALAPLRGSEAEEPVFIPADFHWSSAGARAVAEATAKFIATLPGYDALDKTRHETRSTGEREIFSEIRRQIQARCTQTVPPAKTETFETTALSAPDGGGLSIFAAEAGGPSIALVGTSMSRLVEFNFDGFLAQHSELDVANYALTGGNQFGSIISYLTSDDFAQRPPAFLVWENPVYNNLGEFGELPLRELIAAALDDCVPLELSETEATVLRAEIPAGSLEPDHYIRAFSGTGVRGRAIEMTFRGVSEFEIVAKIERAQRLEPSSRFYQFMRPYWDPEIDEVTVAFDRPLRSDASLSICNGFPEEAL
jgi:alginate biosynthesis protein AlgX